MKQKFYLLARGGPRVARVGVQKSCDRGLNIQMAFEQNSSELTTTFEIGVDQTRVYLLPEKKWAMDEKFKWSEY